MAAKRLDALDSRCLPVAAGIERTKVE